ncbi:LysR family transcriptional regulator [Ottowia thiooxydans]
MENHNRSLVSIQQLRCFESIYRLRSITRAASELGLTQPALSKALASLRTEFRDQLFVRTPSHMEATTQADRMIQSVRKALHIVDVDLRAGTTFDPRVARRGFTLCCSDLGTLVLAPSLLAYFRANAPHVRLRVVPPVQIDMALGLAQGEIDLVIGAFPELSSDVYQQVLFSDTYSCLVSAQHPRIGKAITLEQFVSEYHVVASATRSGHQHSAVERRIIELCGADGIAVRVPSFLEAPPLVERTDFLLTMPTVSAKHFARPRVLRLVDCPLDIRPLEVRQYWHQRTHHDSAHLWLRTLVFELFGRSRASNGLPFSN